MFKSHWHTYQQHANNQKRIEYILGQRPSQVRNSITFRGLGRHNVVQRIVITYEVIKINIMCNRTITVSIFNNFQVISEKRRYCQRRILSVIYNSGVICRKWIQLSINTVLDSCPCFNFSTQDKIHIKTHTHTKAYFSWTAHK